MDGLTFTSAVIDSLAWPCAFLVALWMFKTPLDKLIRTITNAEMERLAS